MPLNATHSKGEWPIDNYRIGELLDEYFETRRYVEEEKLYWLFLDAERHEEMQYSLFNYFPAAHYRMPIENASKLQEDESPR